MSTSQPAAATSDDYAWADYMIYMEAGADIVGPPAPPAPAKAVTTPKILMGLTGSTLVAILAMALSEARVWPFTDANGLHPFDSAGLAILIGLVLGNTLQLPSHLQPGIKFAVKKLLPLGIILMGARLNMTDLLRVGVPGLLLSVVEIVFAIGILLVLGRSFKLGRKIAMLLGVGTGICGGSAILAAAPVIEAEEEDVIFSVTVVSLLGTVAMFFYPIIGHLLHMPHRQFGLWAGLTLHQTPQVVAAGFTYGNDAGEIATIVKLARVCLLAPAIFIVGYLHARSKAEISYMGAAEKKKKINYRSLVPTFVLGLFIFVILRTAGLLPNMTFHFPEYSRFGMSDYSVNMVDSLKGASNFCIVISMAAAGLETKFSVLKKIGHAPLIAATTGFLIVSAIILGIVHILPV